LKSKKFGLDRIKKLNCSLFRFFYDLDRSPAIDTTYGASINRLYIAYGLGELNRIELTMHVRLQRPTTNAETIRLN